MTTLDTLVDFEGSVLSREVYGFDENIKPNKLLLGWSMGGES